MSAAGKVVIGFSKPYVATYTNTNGTITYSDAQLLARGVDVTITPETSDEEIFYADNIAAESAGSEFTGGTVDYTVDGLFVSAEKFIYGLDDADDDGWTHYGANVTAPYLGSGFIVKCISDGVTYYQPILLRKIKFQQATSEAATQEDTTDFQTQSLTATIFRDDSSDAEWKWVGADYSTETEAETVLQTALGYTETSSEE